MSILNSKTKFSDEQLESFEKIKETDGWGVVSMLAIDVLKDMRLDDVGDDLSSEEYKIQCLARKMAKKMFKTVFSDIKEVNKTINIKKVNYE